MTAFDYLKNFMMEAFHTTAQPDHRTVLELTELKRGNSAHQRPMNIVYATPNSATIFRR